MGSAARDPGRRISDEERRARIVARHHLDRSAPGVAAAAQNLVALHSSDPLTPYLSARARVAGFEIEDLDRALLEERSLVRLHAMRRTLFVIPADDLHVFHGAVGRAIAQRERRRLEGWVQVERAAAQAITDGDGRGAGLPDTTQAWLSELEERVLQTLAGGEELLTRELTERVPELAVKITLGSGKWTTRAPLSSRLLFLMAMEGRIVRTRSAGSWRSSQYRWAAASWWLDGASGGGRSRTGPPSPDAGRARAELLRRYLARFGPATLDDLRWWTGWGAAHARKALGAVGAEPVELEGGGEGFVLPGDLVAGAPGNLARSDGARVAFLPALDPTTMGWKHRAWYLGPHGKVVFDRNGNAGPTIWADGRVVGGWGLSPQGSVVFRLLERVPAEVEDQVAEEASSLGQWLGGEVITPRFRTPLEKKLGS